MGKSKWYTLIIICLAQLLCSSDNAIMFNSLESLVTSFHSNVAAVQLANSIYPLIAGALMLAGGLLGLIIGWKKLLYIGLLILTAGEVTAVLSPDMLVFTWVARILAGIGASLAIPAAIGLIPATYSGKDLAIGFGAIGAANGIAAAFAPILGGWIIDLSGWRTAFLFLAIVLGVVFVGALRINEKAVQRMKIKFDYLGTILFAFSMILITLSLVNISAWSFKTFIAALATGVAVLIIFVNYQFKLEKKRQIVLFPSIFLKSKETRAGLIMTALIFFITGGLSFVLVTHLQIVLGFNALQTGFALMVFSVGIILFSIGTPIIIKNPNPRIICQAAIILAFIACLIIAFAVNPSHLGVLFQIGVCMVGISAGLLSSQSGVIVTSNIPKDYAAQSGGIQGSMRNIGQAIGIAIIGVIMVYTLTQTVKHDILKDPKLQAAVAASEIKLTKSIPFVNNKRLQKYLDKIKITDAEKNILLSTNAESGQRALRISYVSYAAFILLFLFFTFQIPTSYSKKEEKS